MTPPHARVYPAFAVMALVSLPVHSLARDRGLQGTASASLGGTVVADDTGRPVAHALVTVKGVVPEFAQVASTDIDGRFAFTGLPVGDVTITATKATYLTVYYGAHDAIRGPAVPFALTRGSQAMPTLRLVRGAVIAGTVTGPTGRPQAGVQVFARQSRLVSGSRRVIGGSAGKGGITDERGRYRVWGLAPGDYVVEATPVDVQTEARRTSDAVIAWAMALPRGAEATAPPSPAGVVRFAPVYYPGTIDGSQVAPVAVGAGEERDGVDLALQMIQTADLRGAVVGTDGQPVPHEPVALDGVLDQLTTVSDEAGRFEFRGVAPGLVTLSARGSSRRREALNTPTPEDLWGSLDVTVSGDDQSGLLLSLRRGMTAAGRVVFDGAAPRVDPTFVMITLTAEGERLRSAAPPQTNVAADGTFTLTGLAPGQYHVHAAVVPPVSSGAANPWLVKSVIWRGQDLLDGALDLSPDQSIDGIVVVFSNRQTALTGTFFDSAGKPVAGYDVVIFAADKRFWTPQSRRIQHVLVGHDGRFDFANLPAGDYLLAAVTQVDPNDLADPAWLDDIAPVALHVTLAAGERKVQDIRLGK